MKLNKKLTQVTINTRRTRNKRKRTNIKSEKKEKENKYVMFALIIHWKIMIL